MFKDLKDRVVNYNNHNVLTFQAEWNDDKQLKLENYVKSIVNKSNNVNDFFARVEWLYLQTYLNIRNEQFIQMKVDEIYEEQYTTKLNNNNENTIIDNWRHRDSPVYDEVSRLIKTLNLQGFEANDVNEQNQGTDGIKERHTNNTNQLNEQNLNGVIEEDFSWGTEAISKVEESTASSSKLRMPKLTKNQRRMSLDLIYTSPKFPLKQPNNIVELRQKRPTLSKPASTTTTNVNVLTKSDVNTDIAENNKKRDIPHTGRFQEFLRKIKLKITRNEVVSATKSPLILQLDDRLKDKPNNIRNEVTNSVGQRKEEKDSPKSTALKKTRGRYSFGENLPLYIRQQLNEEQSKSRSLPENSTSHLESASSPSITKKQSRMYNLLENSQSLYTQSMDLSLISTGVNQDDSKMSNTCSNSGENGRATENDDISENGSDDDKEYILPDLLTRYYGIDENQDDIMNNINEIEDVNDFINVGNYHAYEDIEDDEGYNDDEEYLFKI